MLRRFRSFTGPQHRRAQVAVFSLVAVLGASMVVLANHERRGQKKVNLTKDKDLEISSVARQPGLYTPTADQWATLKVEPVGKHVFRSEHSTEGKIAINEDRATPVFSPYAGRVTRLLAKPGDVVQPGQPLFFIEAADMVQAQNEFAAATAALNKTRSRQALTELVEKQNKSLYESKAGSLREFQQAQAEVSQARSDVRTAESALEAARNRLRLLGKTDEEIATFRDKGIMSPETPIYAPIGGTVVQRRVGPGQYVSYTSTGSVDPVFLIGDLSTVWVVAYVRETAAPKVRIDQTVAFGVLAYPDKVFEGKVSYVAAALDPNSRRLMVRALVDNSAGTFKPEMFASVVIYTDEGSAMPAVARDAVIFEAATARVWVVRADNSIELRPITTGATSGDMIQVMQGLQPGERVVTRGGLFVDKAAGS